MNVCRCRVKGWCGYFAGLPSNAVNLNKRFTFFNRSYWVRAFSYFTIYSKGLRQISYFPLIVQMSNSWRRTNLIFSGHILSDYIYNLNQVNKSSCEFCAYHVTKAYKNSSSTRSDLQSAFSGNADVRSRIMNKIAPKGHFLLYSAFGHKRSLIDPFSAIERHRRMVRNLFIQIWDTSASYKLETVDALSYSHFIMQKFQSKIIIKVHINRHFTRQKESFPSTGIWTQVFWPGHYLSRSQEVEIS